MTGTSSAQNTPGAPEATSDTPAPAGAGKATGRQRSTRNGAPCADCARRQAQLDGQVAAFAAETEAARLRQWWWIGAAVAVGLAALTIAVAALARGTAYAPETDGAT